MRVRSGVQRPREPLSPTQWDTISVTAAWATDRTASGSTYSVSSVLGRTTIGASGTPLPRIDALARVVKRSVTNTTEGRPPFTNRTLSWTLHAVQDPQLASPTIASWALA